MSRNLTNLDLIRSVAVLLVAGSHLELYTNRGFLPGWAGITGVCIFFVHTSLVLMWSLERDPKVGRFYLRRAFRIYPLWLVVLLLTVVTRLPMSPVYAPHFVFFKPDLKDLVANSLLICNLWRGPRIVGASWSLPIEVQMYLFLPFLFLFARATRLLWPLVLIDVFIAVHDRQTLSPFTSVLPMCAPYFIPGVMAYVLLQRSRLRVLPGWSFVVFFAALTWAGSTYGSFRKSWLFCLLLGLGIPFFKDLTWTPVRVAAHTIAKYSYGVYLGHIAAIGVSVYVLRDHSLALRVAAFFGLFCGLPVVFYHAVEEPMIRVGARLAKRMERGEAPRVTERSLELEPAP